MPEFVAELRQVAGELWSRDRNVGGAALLKEASSHYTVARAMLDHRCRVAEVLTGSRFLPALEWNVQTSRPKCGTGRHPTRLKRPISVQSSKLQDEQPHHRMPGLFEVRWRSARVLQKRGLLRCLVPLSLYSGSLRAMPAKEARCLDHPNKTSIRQQQS